MERTHFLEYIIKEKEADCEVLAILRGELNLTTKKIRALKKEDNGILLDGIRVGVRQKVAAGQVLKIMLNDRQEEDHILPWQAPLKVLYEDQDLIFVNKPSGIVSHPSLGHKYDSLANIVKAYFLQKDEDSGIHLIGRLDKDTSGILGIAKNGVTKERMIRLRQNGGIHKEYLALIYGHIHPGCGVIRIPMEEYRDPEDFHKLKMRSAKDPQTGLQAVTHYELIEEYAQYSLVKLWLETGRMHQIRFHMAELGHPLLGDPIYGHAGSVKLGNLNHTALHAWRVEYKHPFTGEELCLECGLPEDLSGFVGGGYH